MSDFTRMSYVVPQAVLVAVAQEYSFLETGSSTGGIDDMEEEPYTW